MCNGHGPSSFKTSGKVLPNSCYWCFILHHAKRFIAFKKHMHTIHIDQYSTLLMTLVMIDNKYCAITLWTFNCCPERLGCCDIRNPYETYLTISFVQYNSFSCMWYCRDLCKMSKTCVRIVIRCGQTRFYGIWIKDAFRMDTLYAEAMWEIWGILDIGHFVSNDENKKVQLVIWSGPNVVKYILTNKAS